MPSLEPEWHPGEAKTLRPSDRRLLLEVARRSVAHGLRVGRPLEVNVEAYPPTLRERRATFVTLRLGEALRGCTGTLEAVRPLVADVAVHAFTAAFADPRFPPLLREEFPDVRIHISILGTPEPLPVGSEEELLAAVRPGVDGLILEDTASPRRATFLPAVWESLPDPLGFVRELKAKAGLPADAWSPTLRFWRYTTASVSDEEETPTAA